MGNLTIGSTVGIPANATRHQVNIDAEIGKGNLMYLQSPKQGISEIMTTDWLGISQGQLLIVKSQLESQIQGSRVIWINMSWDFAIPNPLMPIFTVVTGLRFEAVIKNENAGLTGLEIIAVIGAIAFLAAVIAGIALASWAVYEIMTAAIELGPVATVGIGLIVVVLIGVGLLLLFGVKFKGKAGKVAVKAGK